MDRMLIGNLMRECNRVLNLDLFFYSVGQVKNQTMPLENKQVTDLWFQTKVVPQANKPYMFQL